MTKRRVFRLYWNHYNRLWQLEAGHIVSRQWHGNTKKEAIKLSAHFARDRTPSQLVVHNRDGTIAFERTYGADPERSKG